MSAMSDDCIWDPFWVDAYEEAADKKQKVDIVKLLVEARRKICRDRQPVFPLTVEDFKDELKHRSGATLVWERKLCNAYLTKRFKPEDVELTWLLDGYNSNGARAFIIDPIKSIWRGCRAMERYVQWYQDVTFQFTPEKEGAWHVKILFRGELVHEDVEVEHSEGVML